MNDSSALMIREVDMSDRLYVLIATEEGHNLRTVLDPRRTRWEGPEGRGGGDDWGGRGDSQSFMLLLRIKGIS